MEPAVKQMSPWMLRGTVVHLVLLMSVVLAMEQPDSWTAREPAVQQ